MTEPALVYTDPETLATIKLKTIDDLVDRFRTSRTEPQRNAITGQLLTYGTSLSRVRDELHRKLDAGLDILGLWQEGDPAREASWMQWKADYEAVCDRLNAIQFGVLNNRWDLVVPRKTDEQLRLADQQVVA